MANDFLILGSQQYPLTSGPTRINYESSSVFPKHSRIGDQQALQAFGGSDLEKLRITLGLNREQPTGLVEPRLRALQAVAAQRRAIAVSFGAGIFDGFYVIEGLRVSFQRTDGAGQILAASVSLELLGSTDPSQIVPTSNSDRQTQLAAQISPFDIPAPPGLASAITAIAGQLNN